jgi:hypothetical protein
LTIIDITSTLSKVVQIKDKSPHHIATISKSTGSHDTQDHFELSLTKAANLLAVLFKQQSCCTMAFNWFQQQRRTPSLMQSANACAAQSRTH